MQRSGARDDDAGVGAEGDPVCWAERVCDACGALEDGPPSPVCPRCGQRRAPADGGG